MTDKEINQEIIESDKPIKDLTYLFNEAQIKQSMLRAQKLSRLQDKVVDNVEKRIDNKSDNFTNAELLNAIQILQKTTDSNLTYINSINEKPQIQLVNNNLNVNIEKDEFDAESRERIMNAVSQILALTEKQEEHDYIEGGFSHDNEEVTIEYSGEDIEK